MLAISRATPSLSQGVCQSKNAPEASPSPHLTFYHAYTTVFHDELQHIRKALISGRDTVDTGFISQLGGLVNQAGALVPIAGAGLVASFIASALTMYDKSKQAARMQKLLTLATTPPDALDETARSR